LPSVAKLDTARVTRINQMLDSKRNNWPLWYDSIRNMFKMNNVTEYTEGQICCPDPVGQFQQNASCPKKGITPVVWYHCQKTIRILYLAE